MASQNALNLVVEERKTSRPSNVGVYQAAPAFASTGAEFVRSMMQHEYTIEYLVSGTKDEGVLRERVEDPDYGFPRLFRGRKLSRYTTQYLGNLQWNVTSTYSDQLYNIITTASTGGGTKTISKSVATPHKYPADAPDMQGAIEYDGKKVKGTSITVPNTRATFVWRMTRQDYENPIDMTAVGLTPPIPAEWPQNYDNWLDLFADYTGKATDSQGWPTSQGYKQRELVLFDAVPRVINNDTVEIQLEFGIRRTGKLKVPATVDPTEPEIDVAGWDYPWYRYQEKVEGDTDVKTKFPVPIQLYVDQIYEERRFERIIPAPEPYILNAPLVLDNTPPDSERDTVNTVIGVGGYCASGVPPAP